MAPRARIVASVDSSIGLSGRRRVCIVWRERRRSCWVVGGAELCGGGAWRRDWAVWS